MRWGNELRGIALMLGALALLAMPMAAGRARTAASDADLDEKLAPAAESDIELPAL